jgi:hypothetical protein
MMLRTVGGGRLQPWLSLESENMNERRRPLGIRVFILVAGWILGLVTLCGQGQAPRLAVEEIRQEGIRFRAGAAAGTDLTLEGSFDLRDWFRIGSASAVNGSAEFVHSNSIPASGLFYRVRVGSAGEPLRLEVQTDPARSAAGLITPTTGGRMSLQSSDGVRFDFVAPTNAVLEPVAVRMTLITNFTTFPENDGFRAAVLLEPEGLEFMASARLTLTFPGDIPGEELTGYSFDGDGTGFHLIAARPVERQVVLSVDYFSGKGVASFRNTSPPTFDKAWTRQKDARYAAQDRHARRVREIIRDEYAGRIDTQTANLRIEISELDMVFDVYRNGLQPFLRTAENDCAVGRGVVISELNRLINTASRVLGAPLNADDPLQKDLREIMPKVRCACARELIRRCEQEPGVPGKDLVAAMEDLLLDSRVVTGRTDAQGCDLGSDEQILQRLMSGPCFGEWEGSIELERVTSMIGEGRSGSRTWTWDDETRELYTATVTRVLDRRTFNTGGKRGEGWTLETKGPFHTGIRIDQVIVDDPPNGEVVKTTTIRSSAAESVPAHGDISLRIVDGKLESLGAGGGASPGNIAYTVTNDTDYRCKVPFPPNNPCPTGNSFQQNRTFSIFQGYGVEATEPNAMFTSAPGRITASWFRVRETEQFFGPPLRVEERIRMSLFRRPRP